MELLTDLYLGDSVEELRKVNDNSVDLIVTSPPYADQRKDTYGGIHQDKYVEWFLPISKELLRVLKPTGTFILNIKEKVVDGERSTYVMELILAMRKQCWFWIAAKKLYGPALRLPRQKYLEGTACHWRHNGTLERTPVFYQK